MLTTKEMAKKLSKSNSYVKSIARQLESAGLAEKIGRDWMFHHGAIQYVWNVIWPNRNSRGSGKYCSIKIVRPKRGQHEMRLYSGKSRGAKILKRFYVMPDSLESEIRAKRELIKEAREQGYKVLIDEIGNSINLGEV